LDERHFIEVLTSAGTAPALPVKPEMSTNVRPSPVSLPRKSERKAGGRMVLTIKGVEYAFRWCPADSSMMDSRRSPDEKQHQVTLTQGFWMLETEVMQAMWESVMGNNPSFFEGCKRLPVETVSWDDCQEFIEKINGLAGGYTIFTVMCGSGAAIGMGDYLRAGDVNHRTDPVGTNTCSNRVLRCGSWSCDAGFCRSAVRFYDAPGFRESYLGFRLSLVSVE